MTERTNDEARRAYWIEQMDAAFEYMEKMRAYPVEEVGEDLAPLPAAAEEAGVEVAFASRKAPVGFDRLFYLREGLVQDFVNAARAMNERGWVLKVEDGFRTRAIQKGLGLAPYTFDVILERVMWELRGERPSAEFMLRRVTALVATCPKIGTHMSGSAMDISVLSRDDGRELDRGGPYITLSEATPMAAPFISEEARRNRDEIAALMRSHGFMAYPYEFWHYSKDDAYAEYLNRTGRPARYGAVDAALDTGEVTPIPDPTRLLCSMAEIQGAIEGALSRLS